MGSRRIALFSLTVGLSLELAVACGGGTTLPQITSISPSTAQHGSPIQPLAVFGRNFLNRYAPDAGNPAQSKQVGSWTIELTDRTGVTQSFPATLVSSTRLEVTVQGLPPQLFDVSAVNVDIGQANTLTTALFISGPYYLVVSNETGSPNVLSLPVQVLDARKNPTTFDTSVVFPVLLSSVAAGVANLVATSGAGASPLLVHDSRAELVQVTVVATAASLVSSPAFARFIAGPINAPRVQAIVCTNALTCYHGDGTCVNPGGTSTGTAGGIVLLEDQWGNPSPTSAPYTATLSVKTASLCTGVGGTPGVDPPTISIAAGGTAFTFHAFCSCGGPAAPTMNIQDVTTSAPAYPTSTGMVPL